MNNSNVVDVQAQLLRASREGNLALVKELVGWQGMDPNSHKKDGRTPLMLASLFGREEVVAFLLCLPSINTEAKNVGGEMTALHYAAARGHLQVVKLLLDHGADLAAVTKRCCTPLIMAVGRGRVVKLLLDYGADPAAVDVRGITALMKAAMNGRGGGGRPPPQHLQHQPRGEVWAGDDGPAPRRSWWPPEPRQDAAPARRRPDLGGQQRLDHPRQGRLGSSEQYRGEERQGKGGVTTLSGGGGTARDGQDAGGGGRGRG